MTQAARFAAWMTGTALPFWATVGHDGMGRGFVEQLTLAGVPAALPYKRVRVQARQIYVFSHAALLGWRDGLTVAEDGYRFLVRHALRPDGAWVRRLDRAGGVLDPTADLYDLAFVLFALAWYFRATGEAAALALAGRTLDWIEAEMPASGQPGFENSQPVQPGPRQQNPHMHLLEALLALHEASGAARYAEAAGRLLDLFETKLFDPPSGTLAEQFTADWRRLGEAGVAAPARVEPGHHFEWCWLLQEAHRLLGRDLRPLGARLYGFARRAGTDPATGLVFDSVLADGTATDRGTRLWPQTEAIRAYRVMGEAAAAEGLLAGLFGRFLDPAPPGGWIDHFSACGAPRVAAIPASSLYHLLSAHAAMRGCG